MELLKDIVNFSGKSGLFRILKPGRGGIIVESLDEKRDKQIVGTTARVSILKDISIFMADSDKATPLADILATVHAKQQSEKIDGKAMSDYELTDFMAEVLPGYDTQRVYLSDIKKLINWYNILIQYVPELFEEKTEEIAADSVAETTVEAELEVQTPAESK